MVNRQVAKKKERKNVVIVNSLDEISDERRANAKRILLPYEFTIRDYQMPVWDYLDKGGRTAVTVWHRRAGKDRLAINLLAKKAFERVGLYLHLFPYANQARKAIWNGIGDDGKRFIDAFPKEIIEKTNDTEMSITLTNGSIYQIIGTDNPNALVGINPLGIIFSEFSLMKPAVDTYLSPILAQNKGFAWYIYTPRGMENHGYRLFENAKKEDDCFVELLTIDDTKAISKEEVERDIRLGKITEAEAQQEYYCSFEVEAAGTFFADLLRYAKEEERIGDFPYNPSYPVYTAWDLGLTRTATTCWFYQIIHGKVYFIDYLESYQGFQDIVPLLNQKPYSYAEHFAPWDIKLGDWISGQSRIEGALKLGIRFKQLGKVHKETGIQAGRNIIPISFFDAKKCDIGLQALNHYHREYDEDRKRFKDIEVKDWSSEAADAFKYACLSYEVINSRIRYGNSNNKMKTMLKYNTEYDFFGGI